MSSTVSKRMITSADLMMLNASAKYLVYHYRDNPDKISVVDPNPEVLSFRELVSLLREYPQLKYHRKRLGEIKRRVVVQQQDIWSPSQRELFKNGPAASVELCRFKMSKRVWFQKRFLGFGFNEVAIVSWH